MSRLVAAFLSASACAVAGASATPVEYVRVCDMYGAGYFYVPGTDLCLNPATGQTRILTENGVVAGRSELARKADAADRKARAAADRAETALQGTALAMALPNPFIEKGHSFAIAGNFATFEETGALGFAGAFKVNEHLTLSAAGSLATSTGRPGAARAGFNFSW